MPFGFRRNEDVQTKTEKGDRDRVPPSDLPPAPPPNLSESVKKLRKSLEAPEKGEAQLEKNIRLCTETARQNVSNEDKKV